MLPEDLVTSHKRYKADTDYVTVWLASTAQRCGYLFENSGPGQAVAKPPKLKGRPRLLAKQAMKSRPEGATNVQRADAYSNNAVTQKLRVRDFLPMAKCIAATNPPVHVPDCFISVLDRAISSRRHVSRSFYHQSTSSDSSDQSGLASDSQHKRFVAILEEVRNELSPRTSQDLHHQGDSSEKQLEAVMLNRFEALEIEEPSVEDDTATRVPSTLATSKAPTESVGYTLMEDDSYNMHDAVTALDQHLEDLNSIRCVINEIWQNYRTGGCDLISAALTSNTAMTLARRMEEEMEDFSRYGGLHVLLGGIRGGRAQYMMESPASLAMTQHEQSTEKHNSCCTETFWTTLQIVQGYLAMPPKALYCTGKGLSGTFDHHKKRTEMWPGRIHDRGMLPFGRSSFRFQRVGVL
jgi:hypothetical protein